MQQTLDQNTPVTPDPAVAAEAAPAPCRACGAAMQPEQDWCLSCGAAAPGRLGGRPGWKTVNSVAALTLVLVTGAVAASYAALSGDASSKAGQAPPVAATPVPGAVAALPDAPPVTTTPAAPTVKTPAVKKPEAPSVPVTPVTPVTPITPSFDEGTGDTGSTDGGGDTTTDGTTTGDDTGTGDGTTTGKDTPSTPALTPIEIASDDLTSYDPSGRITKSGDPGNAADGEKTTAWSVTTPDDTFPMQVGLLVDLGKSTTVAQLDVGTTTPGGRIEVYGAAGSALPPDILDTRWEHVASRAKVDQAEIAGNAKGDGSEQIRFLRGGGKFRYVLLWFTDAPKAGPTVRITEVTLKG